MVELVVAKEKLEVVTKTNLKQLRISHVVELVVAKEKLEVVTKTNLKQLRIGGAKEKLKVAKKDLNLVSEFTPNSRHPHPFS